MANPPMPENRDAITADWIGQALTAGGTSHFPTITDVAVEDIGAGVGLLGEILRCRLTYHDAAAAAPETVIVKLPSSQLKSLRISKRLSLYKREYDYYRLVAPHSPLRSPTLFYGDFEERSHRFVLALEDLRDMEMGDQMSGATASQAKRAIRAIAELHGFYWDKVGQPPLVGLHNDTSAKYRILVQMMYLAYLAPTLKYFGKFFSDEMRRLAEAYGPRVADYMSDLAAGPRTFIHGDVRIDNMFFGAGDEEDFALIDWQVSGLGSGLYDIAYFLGGSVSTEVRRKIERDALEEYHEIVCGMGVKNFTLEECWRTYRQHMLGRLLVSVFVCGGLDLSDGRSRQLAEVGLRQSLAAIEDLDAAEYMPARRRPLSLANAFSNVSGGAYKLLKTVR